MTTTHGTSVDVQTPDGVADAYLTSPDDGAAHPGVLVIQDGFGLRPSLRSLADRIAAHGYTVLLPNAYYRHGRASTATCAGKPRNPTPISSAGCRSSPHAFRPNGT